MTIFTNHKAAIGAGFALAIALIGAGIARGGGDALDVFALARWGHFLAGITWIGLLYYLNFCHVPVFAGLSADTKAELTKEGSIVRRVLWWFRWGAMLTFIFGLVLLHGLMRDGGHISVDIMIGAAFGAIMWFNVWFIIWPAQKKILGITPGASADEKAALGKRALIASRTNTILSIPMLFFMAASAHFPIFG